MICCGFRRIFRRRSYMFIDFHRFAFSQIFIIFVDLYRCAQVFIDFLTNYNIFKDLRAFHDS